MDACSLMVRSLGVVRLNILSDKFCVKVFILMCSSLFYGSFFVKLDERLGNWIKKVRQDSLYGSWLVIDRSFEHSGRFSQWNFTFWV